MDHRVLRLLIMRQSQELPPPHQQRIYAVYPQHITTNAVDCCRFSLADLSLERGQALAQVTSAARYVFLPSEKINW